MNALLSLFVVVSLIAVAAAGVELINLHMLFGVIIPYAAIALFFVGVIMRMMKWAKSPVPFRIPTTSGQQKSLPWIKSQNLESPHNTAGVLGRMALEILCFRSLFRNTATSVEGGKKLVFGPTKWLWLASLAFHWTFLVIFLRHFKFFSQPVPFFVHWIDGLDGFLQIGLPVLFLTDIIIVAALTYLFLRRVFIPQLRYISLVADYFPLFLILGIAGTGILMRYFAKVDVVGVKTLSMGLLTFSPQIPDPAAVNWPFYIHLFLVCSLIAYFPFSKLMHLGGVFLSPTRNLANDNRARRHINPWNYPVKTHSYWQYQEEFRDKFEASGLPWDEPPAGVVVEAHAAPQKEEE